MIKAVIFDLDGVVIDSERAHLKTYERLFKKEYGILVNIERSVLIGRSEDENLRYLLAAYNLDGDVNYLITRRSKLLIDVVDREICQIRVVFELLKYLRDNCIPTALATNSGMKYVDAVMKKFLLREYFDAIVSGEHVLKPKPDPEIFINAANKLNVNPHNCLVLEDSPVGIEGAQRAGMKCIGVLSSYNEKNLKGVEGYLRKNGKLPLPLLKLIGKRRRKGM